MAYTVKLTYPVYDLNSSEFIEIIRTILETEFANQISVHGKTFLPTSVKTDEYLLNPVASKEINPAFCSIIKAKMSNTDNRFSDQQNDSNNYIIGILADGLTNLRKIADAIYEILNDMDVKNYIFLHKNSEGDEIISDSGQYFVSSLSTEYEISKTMNDKNIVYGSLVLNAEIAEVPKLNTHPEIVGITTEHKLGENKINITETTNY
jgi:hypothetical protein